MSTPSKTPKLLISAALCIACVNSVEAANYKGDSTAAATKNTQTVATAVVEKTPGDPILKDGAYVGVSLGYDSYKIHEKLAFDGADLTSSYNPTINATGIIGSLTTGVGHYFNEALYLGGEVFLNTSAAYQNTNVALSDAANGLTYNSKFTVTTGYGVSLLPGLRLNDGALVYLRMGYHIARLRGIENQSLNGVQDIFTNTSSWSGGFGFGLGMEEALSESLSLRGEFTHIDYRPFTSTTGGQFAASNNQFLFGLIYHI